MKTLTLFLFALIAAVGCSTSVKKSLNPSRAELLEEIVRIESKIIDGFDNHYDVLAEPKFSESVRHLTHAKEALANGNGASAVVSKIRKARNALEQVEMIVSNRDENLIGILNLRRAAIDGGARSYPELKTELDRIDNEFRNSGEGLQRNLSLREFTRLQNSYRVLEIKAAHQLYVGEARSKIQDAIANGAKKYTPRTLSTAELDVKVAEDSIVINRSQPAVYLADVDKANQSAQFLVEVLNVSRANGLEQNEGAAIRKTQEYYQIRQLKGQYSMNPFVITRLQ